MVNILQNKKGGLSSTEIIILFVAFVAVAFAVLALVTNTYSKNASASHVADTMTNVSATDDTYDLDSAAGKKLVTSLNTLGAKLGNAETMVIHTDGDVYHEELTITFTGAGVDYESVEKAFANLGMVESAEYQEEVTTVPAADTDHPHQIVVVKK